ncbi:MAG: response regulator transcription factor, partial [Sphingobacteriia bacterium]
MRILVVEDEAGIAAFLKQGLEEEAYAVDVYPDGRQGLDIALSGVYDLLLLDWTLPGLSGLELCRRFRKEFPHTPVIFLTARDTVQEAILGLQSGANDYIRKPFHFDELLERIRVQLRPQAGGHHCFSLGDISLDAEAHRVERGGEEIRLTRKEFALLEYLLRNKGRVCRRTRIMEQVWDIHYEANTGVIDVYINA